MLSKFENKLANTVLLFAELLKRLDNKSSIAFDDELDRVEDEIKLMYLEKDKQGLKRVKTMITSVYDDTTENILNEADELALLNIETQKNVE
jgi:hypothetical protein